MSNTYHFKTLLALAALTGMTACGGGGDSGSAPATLPPAAPAPISFPVVATTTTPQGCVREDGKQGVSAVTYTQPNVADGFDRVVLRCDSSSGQRLLVTTPNSLPATRITPELHYIDAAGTVVASRGHALYAMLPGSTQEIELSRTSVEPHVFVGVFNDRALYVGETFNATTGVFTWALVSVTISQTPIRTILHESTVGMRVHNQLVGGRVFFATAETVPPTPPSIFGASFTQYRSVRPDGTDPLLLHSFPPQFQPRFDGVWVHLTLRDREVIYSEGTSSQPTVHMLAIDTPGSDVLIAASFFLGALAVPGAPDRFVALAWPTVGHQPPGTVPILTDVNAERGNIAIRTLPLGTPIGFSQGRLYMQGPLQGEASWLGEGNTAPRAVLTGLSFASDVTDRAIVYSRSPFSSNGTQFARSNLDGSNERMGSFSKGTDGDFPVYTRAGERIYYLREADTINNDVATLDLVTGVESVAYRPNPAQDRIRFFRVGGRLIVWRPAIGADPGWIDSVDLDGNDLRRLAQSPDIFEVKPF